MVSWFVADDKKIAQAMNDGILIEVSYQDKAAEGVLPWRPRHGRTTPFRVFIASQQGDLDQPSYSVLPESLIPLAGGASIWAGFASMALGT